MTGRKKMQEIHEKYSCDTCIKKETCTKTYGFMWGHCTTDYKPKNEGKIEENK